MADATAAASSLPPDLFDQTTILSLLATVAIVLAAYTASRAVLPSNSTATVRFFFIWHLADALCHFILEGSFLYHCFFSYLPAADLGLHGLDLEALFPTPFNFLGYAADRVYGAQSGGRNPFAQLWMVYARADKRWAGVDLVCAVISVYRIIERQTLDADTVYVGRCELGASDCLLRWPLGSVHLLLPRQARSQDAYLDDHPRHLRDLWW